MMVDALGLNLHLARAWLKKGGKRHIFEWLSVSEVWLEDARLGQDVLGLHYVEQGSVVISVFEPNENRSQ